MADVTIKYKSNVIAELSEAGAKTLKTSGKYCEGDIKVEYSPSSSPSTPSEVNHKRYDLSIAKGSGWVYLVDLDAETLAHINDSTFTVSLNCVSSYVYEWYSGSAYLVSNTPFAMQSSYPVYGYSDRQQSETTRSMGPIYYPANNTGESHLLGGYGIFRVNGGKYYLKPTDGFIRGGNYRLVFTW